MIVVTAIMITVSVVMIAVSIIMIVEHCNDYGDRSHVF